MSKDNPESPPKATSPPKAPAKPAAPAKPPAGKAKTDSDKMSRRGFFSWISIAWAAFAASMLAAGAATARFMFPNVLFEPPSSFPVGRPEEFQVGLVDERFKEGGQVWLVREESGMYALSTVCTHLGCTPNWLAAEQKFKCPCHGSGFYITGINFEGPAPRPLERHRIYLAQDGQVWVDRSQKFQQEKDQWGNPGAYLEL